MNEHEQGEYEYLDDHDCILRSFSKIVIKSYFINPEYQFYSLILMLSALLKILIH